MHTVGFSVGFSGVGEHPNVVIFARWIPLEEVINTVCPIRLLTFFLSVFPVF